MKGSEITSIGFDGNPWRLVDQAGKQLSIDDMLLWHGRGEAAGGVLPFRLEGGRAPHKPGSTGRIWTDRGEYFPSVFNVQWVRVDQAAVGEESPLAMLGGCTLDTLNRGFEEMERSGGGFASALAAAYFRADLGNRARIIEAWPDLVAKWVRIAAEERVAISK